jgi:hypothetical protein
VAVAAPEQRGLTPGGQAAVERARKANTTERPPPAAVVEEGSSDLLSAASSKGVLGGAPPDLPSPPSRQGTITDVSNTSSPVSAKI